MECGHFINKRRKILSQQKKVNTTKKTDRKPDLLCPAASPHYLLISQQKKRKRVHTAVSFRLFFNEPYPLRPPAHALYSLSLSFLHTPMHTTPTLLLEPPKNRNNEKREKVTRTKAFARLATLIYLTCCGYLSGGLFV